MNDIHDDAPLSSAEQEAVEWLSRLREGGRRYQAAFEEWYSAHSANADAYDRVLATYQASGRPAAAAAQSRRRRYWGVAVAAVAAVFVCFAYLGVAKKPSLIAESRTFAAATRTGEIKTVALADGTKVTLDTQSAIRADFNTAARRIHLLRGRAHFEVAAEPRPFIVSTDGGSVSTGGAVLDVGYLEGSTQVGLLRGSADVTPLGRKRTPLRMVPGTRLVAARDGSIGWQRRFAASDMRWTTGMLSFEATPVAAVVTAANRYSAARIVLADPSIGELRFTGTIEAKNTLGLARMLAAMFNLRLDMTDPQRLTLSR